MVNTPSLVISASRRTDIPAFFMPWFMEGISRGGFEVMNPYNRRVVRIAATSPPVHTIVFWSKNFAAFLEGGYGWRLQEMGYHLYFQFTINSENRILEPNLPGLDQRLGQLQRLCDQFGPGAVNWRFDPICFYRSRGDGLCSNLDDADRIAATAAGAGIRRCTTSIMDPYAKVTRRTERLHGFTFVDPPREDKIRALLGLERLLATQGIRLFTCCESELLRALPADSSIRAGACIPSELFMELYGGTLSVQRDGGQRVKAGCGCRLSIDIGSYDDQRCGHGCLYCYASPASRKA
ncbi:MAG: DUF1848 family protein [Hyphomicrobiales bacterium]